MIDRPPLLETLRRKISVVKGISEADVLGNLTIQEHLGVSSLELVVIVTDVASELGIDMMKFSERDIITARTVGDLERVFASKIA